MQAGDDAAAEEWLLKAIEEDPANDAAWNQLGIIAFQRKDLDAARGRFEMAQQLNPLEAAYPRNIAYVMAERGELSVAESLVEQSLKINPNVAETYTARAKIKLLQGDRESARNDVKTALLYAPSDPDALALFARLGETP